MTKTKLIRSLAARTGLTQVETRRCLDQLRELAVFELANGRDFLLPAWAHFSVVERKPRVGRNIRTGEPVQIPARRVVRCKASPPFQAACCAPVEES